MELSTRESDHYWSSRPREAEAAAATFPQSSRIRSREELTVAYERLLTQHPHKVPRPDAWGGYRLVPEWMEFWQGYPNRLHDRLRYVRSGTGWETETLSP